MEDKKKDLRLKLDHHRKELEELEKNMKYNHEQHWLQLGGHKSEIPENIYNQITEMLVFYHFKNIMAIGKEVLELKLYQQ